MKELNGREVQSCMDLLECARLRRVTLERTHVVLYYCTRLSTSG